MCTPLYTRSVLCSTSKHHTQTTMPCIHQPLHHVDHLAHGQRWVLTVHTADEVSAVPMGPVIVQVHGVLSDARGMGVVWVWYGCEVCVVCVS